jgi:hypothetical protein
VSVPDFWLEADVDEFHATLAEAPEATPPPLPEWATCRCKGQPPHGHLSMPDPDGTTRLAIIAERLQS